MARYLADVPFMLPGFFKFDFLQNLVLRICKLKTEHPVTRCSASGDLATLYGFRADNYSANILACKTSSFLICSRILSRRC